ncbi:MAG: hypothetical protein HRU29_11930 [Rhizobiales bacterium]|nr:hypothetical protein [Hyphomicrobiales bacterium]NRB15098.1 hypothetical protein [Hyphomicrobiales bacterium]
MLKIPKTLEKWLYSYTALCIFFTVIVACILTLFRPLFPHGWSQYFPLVIAWLTVFILSTGVLPLFVIGAGHLFFCDDENI